MTIILILGALGLIALAGNSGRNGEPAPAISFSVEQWRTLVRKVFAGSGIPESIAMAWMQMESAGNPCAIGLFGIPPREYGLFQLDFQSDSSLGNREQMRAYCQNSGKTRADLERQIRKLTIPEQLQQVQSGLALIKKCRDRAGQVAQQANIGWNQADRWKLVKMHHNLPGLLNLLPQVTQKLGRPPVDFAEYRKVVENSFVKPTQLTNRAWLSAESVGNAL